MQMVGCRSEAQLDRLKGWLPRVRQSAACEAPL